jgi:hypothetical protein
VKRRLLNVLAVLSLLLCLATAGFWSSHDGKWILRDGGGGIAGGSTSATYVLFRRNGVVGLGWTHSDVWFEGEVSAPSRLAFPLAIVSTSRYRLGGA